MLVAAVRGVRAGPEATERFARVGRDTGGRVRIEPLDLAAVTLAEVGDARAPGAFQWAGLRACLTGSPGDAASTAQVREAARGVAQRLGDDPQLAAELLRERLAEAAGSLASHDADGRAQLQAFAAAVAEQLEQAGRGGALADGCQQSMLLCRALSQFQPDESMAAGQTSGSWDDALDELFHPGGVPEHTPAAYMRRLESLANRQDQRLARPEHKVAPTALDVDRFGAEAIERDAAGVVLSLAEDQRQNPRPPAEAGPCVMRHLARRLPAIAERLEFKFLARALELTADPAGDDAGSTSLGEAIDAAFDTPALGAGLAAALAAAGSFAEAEAAIELLAAAGPRAVEAFVTAAARLPPSRSPLRLLGRERLLDLAGSGAQADPRAAHALAHALSPLPFEDARALLSGELVHRDPPRQLHAFRTLLQVSEACDPALLLSLLDDPDPGVCRLALDRLLAPGTPGGPDAVTAWLRERKPRRTPNLVAVVAALPASDAGRGTLHHLLAEPAPGPDHAAASRCRACVAAILTREATLPPDLAAAVAATLPGPGRSGRARGLRGWFADRADAACPPEQAA